MEVEWADQQKINEFSKLNSRLTNYEQIEKTLKQQKEDLDDLEMEIELVDEDEKLLYSVGDAFVYMTQSEIMQRLESDKEQLQSHIDEQDSKKGVVIDRMNELKAALYARFGRENINLERD